MSRPLSGSLSQDELSFINIFRSKFESLCIDNSHDQTTGAKICFSTVGGSPKTKHHPELAIMNFLLSSVNTVANNRPINFALTCKNYSALEGLLQKLIEFKSDFRNSPGFVESVDNLLTETFKFYLQPNQELILQELLTGTKEKETFRNYFDSLCLSEMANLSAKTFEVLKAEGFLRQVELVASSAPDLSQQRLQEYEALLEQRWQELFAAERLREELEAKNMAILQEQANKNAQDLARIEQETARLQALADSLKAREDALAHRPIVAPVSRADFSAQTSFQTADSSSQTAAVVLRNAATQTKRKSVPTLYSLPQDTPTDTRYNFLSDRDLVEEARIEAAEKLRKEQDERERKRNEQEAAAKHAKEEEIERNRIAKEAEEKARAQEKIDKRKEEKAAKNLIYPAAIAIEAYDEFKNNFCLVNRAAFLIDWSEQQKSHQENLDQTQQMNEFLDSLHNTRVAFKSDSSLNFLYDDFQNFITKCNLRLAIKKKPPSEQTIAITEKDGQLTVQMSTQMQSIISAIFYAFANDSEIALWLQEEIADAGGLEAISKYIISTELREVFKKRASIKWAKLPAPTEITLQDLISAGATFETIKEFVDQQKTGSEKLKTTSLKELVTNPHHAKILALLQSKEIIDQTQLHDAFYQAVIIGKSDFLAQNKNLATNWLAAPKTQKLIKTSRNNKANIKFLVNFLAMVENKSIEFDFATLDESKDLLIRSFVVLDNFLESNFVKKHYQNAIELVKKLAPTKAEEIFITALKNLFNNEVANFMPIVRAYKAAGIVEADLKKYFAVKYIYETSGDKTYSPFVTKIVEACHKGDEKFFFEALNFIKEVFGDETLSFLLQTRFVSPDRENAQTTFSLSHLVAKYLPDHQKRFNDLTAALPDSEREKMMAPTNAAAIDAQTYQSTIQGFSQKLSLAISKSTPSNAVERMVNFLCQKGEDLTMNERNIFILPELQEIIFRLINFDASRPQTFATLENGVSFRKFNQQNPQTNAINLAVQLISCAIRNVEVPFWLQDKIIELGQGSKDDGLDKVRAVIKNPQLQRIVDFSATEEENLRLTFAVPKDKMELTDLINSGASAKKLQESLASRKNKAKTLKSIDPALLLANPDASAIIDLLPRSNEQEFDEFRHEVMSIAIEQANADFIYQNPQLLKSTIARKPQYTVANSFFHERNLIANFKTIESLNSIDIGKTSALLAHMEVAAQVFADEFIDYLQEVRAKIRHNKQENPEQNFQLLLISKNAKNGGKRLIDLVAEYCPQNLAALQEIYDEALTPAQKAKLSANTSARSSSSDTNTISPEAETNANDVYNDIYKNNFAKFARGYLIETHDQEGKLREDMQPLYDFADFLNGRNNVFQLSDELNLIYQDFQTMVEGFIYLDESKTSEVPTTKKPISELTSDLLFFVLIKREVPLWLQDRVNEQGGLDELKKSIPNKNIHKLLDKAAFAQLPTENISLQLLIDRGSSLEKIKAFVSDKKNAAALEISAIGGIVIHPDSQAIVKFLSDKKLISYETHQTVIYDAFNQAILVGAFGFLKCDEDWRKQWENSADTTKILTSSTKEAAKQDVKHIKYLVNFTHAASPQLRKDLSKKKKTIVMKKDVMMNYLKMSILNKPHPDYARTAATLAQTGNPDEMDEVLKNFLQLLFEISPNNFEQFIEALNQQNYVEPEYQKFKLFSTVVENSLIVHSRNNGGPLLFLMLLRHSQNKDIAAFRNGLEFIKNNCTSANVKSHYDKSTIELIFSLSYVIKKEGQPKTVSLTRVISEEIPAFFYEFFKNYLQKLPPVSQQAILFGLRNTDKDQFCSTSFLTDAFAALKDNFLQLKEVLEYAQRNLSAKDFQQALTFTRYGSQKNPRDLILEHFEGQEEPLRYFQNLFNEAKIKEEESRPYLKARDGFAARFEAFGHKSAKFDAGYSIKRLVNFIHQKNILPYSVEDARLFKISDLKEIIWSWMSVDITDENSLERIKNKTSFRRSKQTRQVNLAQVLAVETLFFGVQGLAIPLWLQEKIKSLDPNRSLEEGLKKVTAAVDNPHMAAILNGQRQENSKPFLTFAKLPQKVTFASLLECGALPDEFRKYFKSLKKKDKKADLDFFNRNPTYIFHHPNSEEIIYILNENDFQYNDLEIFGNACVEAAEEFLTENFTLAKNIYKTVCATQIHLPTLPNWMVNMSFAQQRALLPFYGDFSEVKAIEFSTPAGLLKHLETAAKIFPNEFIDYLQEVRAKIPEKDFKILLQQDLTKKGIIDFVKENCPQDLEHLKRIYDETYGAASVDRLFKKFVPKPSLYEIHGVQVKSEEVEKFHGA